MWIKRTSDLSESTRAIITPGTSHLLIAGEHAALTDAGSLLFSDKLLKGISESFEEQVTRLIVFLHDASFSSVSGLNSLRNNFDELVCYGSPELAKIISSAEYLNSCFEFYVEGTEALDAKHPYSLEDFKSALQIDVTLEDGEEVSLGDGVNVKAIYSPGYRKESTSYLVLPDRVLSAGKALGAFHGRSRVSVGYQEGFDSFMKTADALSDLDYVTIVTSHTGAITGELAEKFVSDVKFEADRINSLLLQEKSEGKARNEVFQSLLSEWKSLGVSPEGPFKLLQDETAHKMINAIF